MITPSLATFLITLVNVGVLFLVLRAILFKPVTKFMEDRAAKIQDAIVQAEKDKNQAKLLFQQYEDQLKNAEGEAEAIIRTARETGQQQADKIIAEGKEAGERILENARRQIEAEQHAALARFRAEAVDLVIAASSKVLERDLNQDDNRRCAGMLLEELAAKSGEN
jgi:F-type H+-transporting ATPase subunit b